MVDCGGLENRCTLTGTVGSNPTASATLTTLTMHNLKGDAMRYKIALHKSDEGYSVSAPGLPGCWSQGKTEAEALANIESAIREYFNVVEDLLKDAEVREIELTP